MAGIMGKWQSAVFGALYNKTDDDEYDRSDKNITDDKSANGHSAKSPVEESSKTKWQKSIITAIYGESGKEVEGSNEQNLTKGQSGDADKADPVAVAERIFAKAESKRNSVMGILGSFAGGGEFRSWLVGLRPVFLITYDIYLVKAPISVGRKSGKCSGNQLFSIFIIS